MKRSNRSSQTTQCQSQTPSFVLGREGKGRAPHSTGLWLTQQSSRRRTQHTSRRGGKAISFGEELKAHFLGCFQTLAVTVLARSLWQDSAWMLPRKSCKRNTFSTSLIGSAVQNLYSPR